MNNKENQLVASYDYIFNDIHCNYIPKNKNYNLATLLATHRNKKIEISIKFYYHNINLTWLALKGFLNRPLQGCTSGISQFPMMCRMCVLER
jgi:hypothetical protein